MKKLTLDDKGVIKLLSDLTEHAGKRGIMFQMLLHMLSDDQINMLFNYLHKDNDYQCILFKINDKVVFKPGKYEFSNMNIDAMQDQSIILDGYMSGKIMSSPDYGNEFNPTYYRMTLEVPVLDDDNNIVMKTHDVDTLNLKFMSENQKRYFKHIWE
tara:strand:- start:1483 stop:1950 length:468 start_codon:yes stop_codon:yes gene_type:complete